MKYAIEIHERRIRKGDPHPQLKWQADIWLDGIDHHAIGETPAEALVRAARHWHAHEMAGEKP